VTTSACVIAGATPEQVAALAGDADVALRANALGTLVTGRPGGLAVDAAGALPGPVYDVLYNPGTGWLAITIYRGDAPPVRWDNRPGADAGYPRVDDVLGATTALAILAALDVPSDVLGYASA
jgi:hypothetical protein